MVRKPSDLDEVKSITRANSDRLETVAVVETIMPRDIKKYRYNIRDFFRDNKQMIVDEYRKLRPDDAPPQSKI